MLYVHVVKDVPLQGMSALKFGSRSTDVFPRTATLSVSVPERVRARLLSRVESGLVYAYFVFETRRTLQARS